MAAAQVIGNDVAVGVAGMSGAFELNVFMPLIAHDVLQSCRLIADGCDSFREHCASGIEPVPARIAENLERSLMLVTALAPHVGYDAAARVARSAHASGKTLREAAIELGVATGDEFDRWVRPEDMVGRR
jgi:fumarate hydratase class II